MRAHRPRWLHRSVVGMTALVGATLIVAACADRDPPTAPVLSPATVAPSVSSTSEEQSASDKFKAKQKPDVGMDTNQIPDTLSTSSPPAMRTANASVDLDALRKTLTALHKKRIRGKELDYSLSLKALDAMAAPTPEERRRILAELPIRLEKTVVGTDAAGRQIIRTRVIVRGIEKKVYDRVVGSRTDDTPDVGIGEPLEGDVPLEESSMPVAAELYCPEDTEDCIPEPELEQLQIEWAAIESDAADTEAAVNADFNACVWVNDECRDATSLLLLEADFDVGLEEDCDMSLSDLPAGADLGAGAGCLWVGTVMLSRCALAASAVGAVGGTLATLPASWKLFLLAVPAAIAAHDDCVGAINDWIECRAADDTASFGGWLRKQETTRIGAHS